MIETIFQVLAILCISALAFQYLYMLYFFTGFPKKMPVDAALDLPKVSLVICARNELENLRKHLHPWLSQKHPHFQVVVVNDRSWDASEDYLDSMAQIHSNLKVVNLRDADNFWIGKKFALTIGIKAAEHSHLILTDADCMPASDQWLSQIAVGFNSADIVLGYGGYERKGGVGSLVVFETVHSALHWMSWAARKKTYMGVGRNLAYKKEMFLNDKGFSTHMHIPSGDDDLFIGSVAKKNNVALRILPEAFTWSSPPVSFSKWIQQRSRHLTTAKLYKPLPKFLLGTWSFTALLLYLLIPIVIFQWKQWPVLALLFGLRWLVYWIFLLIAGIRLKQWKPILLLPFFEPFLIVAQSFMHFSNARSKRNRQRW
jgi:glycosyltransferase involved in cell wall biosynthesis